MLIKKTPWLTDSGEFYGYLRIKRSKTIYLRMCKSGVMNVFDVPDHAECIRFYVYNTPSKNRVKVELTTDGCFSIVWVSSEIHVDVSDFISFRTAKRLINKQQIYYVECEYA